MTDPTRPRRRMCDSSRRATLECVDERVSRVLTELHRYGVAFDAGKSDRRERLRNLEPDSAQLLSLLVRATNARAVLELGTSNGYSTVALGEAVRANGGRLTSVEIEPERSAQAAVNIDRAGLSGCVDLRIQDAAETLRVSADASWDMIFLDAERPAYVSYWPELRRVLRPGGLLAVDNVVSHADQVSAFRQLVNADDGVRQALAPTGAGVLLVVVDPAAPM